jgi:hypothetical protein
MSSATPSATMMNAAASSPTTRCPSANTRLSCGMLDAAPKAARMPKNIATPPSRGVGRVCTSRSRILGYSRYFVLSFHTAMATANVTTAATPTTST